jgi:AcrR family transcriptional regulator
MNPAQPRGPYAKGIVKRQQILDEALRAYAESGHSGPTLAHIAAQSGLSERGLLHYFSSRADLFTSILARRDAEARESFTADEPVDVLLHVVEAQSATPGLTRLFLEMAAASSDDTHPAHELFVGRYSRLVPVIQRMIDQAAPQPAPAPNEGDSAWAARMLVAAADGLQVQSLLDPTIDPRADLERLGRLLIDYEHQPHL